MVGGSRSSWSGDSGAAVPLAARLGERPAAAGAGARRRHRGALAAGRAGGWWTLTAGLDPDEFRLDDRRVAAVRVAPVARVNWDSTSRFVAAACEVLAANGGSSRATR